MSAWGGLPEWGAWGSWPLTTSTASTTWGDLTSWPWATWTRTSGFAELPPLGSIRPRVVDEGGIGAVALVAPTLRPLPRVKAHIAALADTGPTVGPASVAASGITVAAPTLAPSSRFMAVTSVDAATLTLFLTPAAEPSTDGLAVIYSATQPSHATPFLWVTPDGDLYLVED